MSITIKQGDSVAIFLDLTVNGQTLTPDMVDDLEVYVGEDLGYYYRNGGVKFDNATQRWYIWPTQEETFNLDEGSYKVEIRPKYRDQHVTVKGYELDDKIKVKRTASREVL